jgi:stage V sporulation protein D (sporulation-specific penicillin-binding protein)
VAAVRDPAGTETRVTAPRALRRVLPPGIAAIVRRAMQRVVEDGTGAVARREGIAIAGKTGTAQKAVPGRGYVDGLHTATFAGFLPVDDPRLVIVTVLDEPDHRWHYASQSAAPLFAAVVDDIRRTTDWLTDPARDGVPVAMTTPADPVPVPDVLFLGSERAVQRLRLAGLEVSGPVTRGEVVMQVPAAGSLVAAGTPVRLVLDPAASETVAACPDFAGLSNREVRALASRLGLSVAIEGVGYVAAQQPAAGADLRGDEITVTMETPWP